MDPHSLEMQRYYQRQNLPSIDHYLEENHNNNKSILQSKLQNKALYPQQSTIHQANSREDNSNSVHEKLSPQINQKQKQKQWMKYYGHKDKYRESQKKLQIQKNCSCIKIFLICLLALLLLGIAGYFYWKCGIHSCSNLDQITKRSSSNNQNTQSNSDLKFLSYAQPTINYISPQIMTQTHLFSKQGMEIIQQHKHPKNKQAHIRKFDHFS